MGARSTLKEKLGKFLNTIISALHPAEVEELPPPPPIPRRNTLNRQGTLRRVGTIREDGTPIRSKRNSRVHKKWDPDAPCGSKDVPANPHLYLEARMTEEELDAAFRESLTNNPFGRQAELSRKTSWDRPLSFYLPQDQRLSWTASQAHLTLVPNDPDGGNATEGTRQMQTFDSDARYLQNNNVRRSRKGKGTLLPPSCIPFTLRV